MKKFWSHYLVSMSGYARNPHFRSFVSIQCHQEDTKAPQDYPTFDPSPAPLLSRIYHHLNTHLERQSPKIIKAIIAFILTTTSHAYLQQVSRSVGYGLDPPRKPPRSTVDRPDNYVLEEEDDKDNDILDRLELLEDTFPDFFPPELRDILPAAQKSLVLLQAAQPDHPLLQRDRIRRVIQWLWTVVEIEAAWNDTTPKPCEQTTSMPTSESSSSDDITARYKPELSAFRLFDLEPSVTPLGGDILLQSKSLEAFIDTFPETFPMVTPTLTHLTSLVLNQLINHVSTLSTALVRLFLSSSGTLNFRAHLLLLRSYLLVTAPPFRSRLAAALFSDSDSCEVDAKAHSMAIRSLHRKPATIKKPGEKMQTQPWAVGLAPALLERETWPPVGADLSFFLRTVIVDSFEGGSRKRVQGEGEGEPESTVAVGGERTKVVEEAEYRLGFASRDLPTGTGREKWLNPLCMFVLPV
jgi:hypothetical protein